MPSASLQSRIQAFEALSSSSSTTFPPSLSTPAANSTSPTSHLLEDPISPTANAFHPIAPFVAPTSSNRSRSPSPSTPSLVSQASFIDLKDWIVEDGPVETPSTFRHTAGINKLNGSRESSRTPSPSRKPIPTNGASNLSTPLINLESPPKPQQRPPLPPRKPSSTTVITQRSLSAGSENGATLRPPGRSDSLTIEHTYPPAAHKFGARRVGHASASSISSLHSVSLSSDGSSVEIHSPKKTNKPPSFTFEADSVATDFDSVSIAESFENVSATSAPSPSTAIRFDWEQGVSKLKTSPGREPPAPSLPNRPPSKTVPVIPPKPIAPSLSGTSSSTATPAKTRRPPPPPPPYQPRSRPSSSRTSVVSTSASTSDRSSILSHATTTSRTSTSTRNSAQFGGGTKPLALLRPTPVPAAARSRYEYLFDSAVKGRRKAEKKVQKAKLLSPPPPPPPPPSPKKGRQAAGWRGLSVDLITNPEDHPILSSGKGLEESDSEEDVSPVAPDAKLNARIVKYIWSASRLDRQKLRNIWNDCDPQRTGFVDRDAFIGGMWRIDEELRKAQLARRTSALTAASSQRIPHRPLLPPPRPPGTTKLLI